MKLFIPIKIDYARNAVVQRIASVMLCEATGGKSRKDFFTQQIHVHTYALRTSYIQYAFFMDFTV